MSLVLSRRKLFRLASPAIILPEAAWAQLNNHALLPGTLQSTAIPVGWSLKAQGAAGAQNNPAVTGLNMTGVNLIVVVYTYTTSASPTFGDSSTNTYTSIKTETQGGSFITQFSYVYAPTVTGSMTFTVTASSAFGSLCVQGWSGSVASPLDQSNGSTTWTAGPPGSIAPGSITPTQASELVIAVLGSNDTASSGNTYTVGGGFTIPASGGQIGKTGSYYGTAMAYLVQTTATAANPTFTAAGAVGQMSAAIASFK